MRSLLVLEGEWIGLMSFFQRFHRNIWAAISLNSISDSKATSTFDIEWIEVRYYGIVQSSLVLFDVLCRSICFWTTNSEPNGEISQPVIAEGSWIHFWTKVGEASNSAFSIGRGVCRVFDWV